MKRQKQLASEKLSKAIVGAELALALLALAALCACAAAQENTAEGWHKKGLELELSDSREEAVQAYDRAIQLDPQNPKYWNDKAFNLWLLHRNQEANQASKKALELYNDTLQENPKGIDSWMGKAQVFNNLARADMAGPKEAYREAALQSYEHILQIDPQNAAALYFKGGALFEMGRHAEAIEALDKALEIGFPPSQEWLEDGALQTKGFALAALGETNESAESYQYALKSYDEAIEKAETPENLSQAWLSKGFILQEQDKYEESIKALDNATDANPKNEMAWRVKGFMLANWMGRYDEGLAALDKALDINPSADVWEAEARVFNELGRYDEALEASDDALVLNQNLTRTWLVKGHALRGLGRHQEALDAYAQAENTYDEQLWGGRGFSLAQLNRSDEAAEALNKSLNASQKVLEKDNKSAYAWFWKGETLRGLGRYQEALEAYDRSLEIGPEKAISAWRGKGFVLKSLGRDSEADAAFGKANDLGYADSIIAQDITADSWYRKSQELFNNVSLDESVQALDEALQMDPGNATLWQTKGSILALMDKKDEANSAFQKADQILNQSIKRCPEDVAALMSKARALQGMGKSDEAIKAVDKAIELYPESIDVRLLKAETLILAGRYNESVEVYDQTREMVPANDTGMLAFILGSKGGSLYDAGRYEEAVIAYNRAMEVSSEESSEYLLALSNKGLALLKLGKPQGALDIFNKTAVMDPVHFGDEYAKGLAFKALGMYDEAISAFNRSIERFPDNPLIWKDKGEALQALGRNPEAESAFAKAKELGYQR